MRQKRSFCNLALLRSDLRRTWPILFTYVFAWLLILPMQILQERGVVAAEARGRIELLLCGSMKGSNYMGLVFGVIWAMALLFYLMNSRSVGLLHSLPASRSCQLRTHLLAGIGSTLAANVLIFAMALLAQARVGVVVWDHSLQWLLVTTVVFLFYFALGTFCSMLTGWLLAVPVLYGAVQCVVFLTNALVQAMESMFYFGYESGSTPVLVRWLTPPLELSHAIDYDTTYTTYMNGPYELNYLASATLVKGAVETVLIYGAVAVILLVVSDWLLGMRRSEVAGDALAFRPLGPMVRWVVGILGGLGLGFLLLAIVDGGAIDSNPNIVRIVICQIIMGAICFLAAQMLIRKNLRIFRESWKELLALCVALVAITVAVKMDVGGFQKRVPAADSVEAVRVSVNIYGQNGGYGVRTSDVDLIDATIAVHGAIVDRMSGNADIDGTTGYFQVVYELKNGGTLTRSYNLTSLVDTEIEKLINLPEMRRSMVMNSFDGTVNDVTGGVVYHQRQGDEYELDTEQAQRLYNAALEDMTNMSLSAQGDYNNCVLYISLYTRGDGGVDINLNPQCTNVLGLLVEFGVIESSADAFDRPTQEDSTVAAGIGLPATEARTTPA